MSKKLYPETDIQNIANAIRTLNGSSDTYTVSEMASAIALPENGYYLKDSTEANPLSITDGEELNAQSCEVSFEPIQDLHGYESPWIDSDVINKEPYLMRAVSGTATRIGNSLYDKLVGGTVAFNQLVDSGTSSVTLTTNHKALTKVNGAWSVVNGGTIAVTGGTDMVIDLTQMFGSTIADYIYSLEQATAGSGVAYFRSLFPKDYYSYNAGQLMSVKALSHKTVGFNAFNVTTGKAKLLGGNQYQITGTYTALSYSAGETLTPDSNGKFTPSASGELTVTGGDNTTCVHLVWDGERDGEYEAYEEHIYPLDSDLELRGIPKLDSNNKLYYDGDTYESDGTVTREYGFRAYQSGDESLADAITDGTNTVYKLTTPTTETADPFTNPQIVVSGGTEEFVDYGVSQGTRDVAIPVGNDTDFYIP